MPGLWEGLRIRWSGGGSAGIAQRAGTISISNVQDASVVVASHRKALRDEEWINEVFAAFRGLDSVP